MKKLQKAKDATELNEWMVKLILMITSVLNRGDDR